MSEVHTPGPWETSGEINARYLGGIGDIVLVRRSLSTDNRYVAMVGLDAMGDDYGGARTSEAEREANARLIAAAPDLLAALRAAKQEMWLTARHTWTMADFKNWAVIQQIDAALEKADWNPRAAIAKAEPSENPHG